MTYVIQLTNEEGTIEYYAPDKASGGYPYKTHLAGAYKFVSLESAYEQINNDPTRSFFFDPDEKVEICELLVAPVTADQIAAMNDQAALDIYRTMTSAQRDSMLALLKPVGA